MSSAWREPPCLSEQHLFVEWSRFRGSSQIPVSRPQDDHRPHNIGCGKLVTVFLGVLSLSLVMLPKFPGLGIKGVMKHTDPGMSQDPGPFAPPRFTTVWFGEVFYSFWVPLSFLFANQRQWPQALIKQQGNEGFSSRNRYVNSCSPDKSVLTGGHLEE